MQMIFQQTRPGPIIAKDEPCDKRGPSGKRLRKRAAETKNLFRFLPCAAFSFLKRKPFVNMP
ncbi:MAG: hypothetical protein DBX51_06205 [Clostridiales bacterium]|nr:MAG: hypothetical protein DBX51_06205 [Clostridiales bacterium]